MRIARLRPTGLRSFWGALDASQRRTLVMMVVVVGALHVIGFVTLFALVAPSHYHLGASGSFTVGIGITAYTLGMRHAFDADHISAIDNTTRKLMSEGKRPLSVGFWFSLGHSTIVFALAFLISIGVRSLDGAAKNGNSSLHQVTGWIGATVSGTFLYIIAGLNIIILVGILKVFREMKTGKFDEAALEEQLNNRGFMNRFFGRMTKAVTKPHQMYPIGALFGLGFDTATEVALLVIAGSAGAAGLPWYAILCLPILFAAGMSLLDAIDGSFMKVRLRLGVLQARPQCLLQHHHHRSVRRRRARDRDDRARRTDRPTPQPVRQLLEPVRGHRPQLAGLSARRHVRRHLGDRALYVAPRATSKNAGAPGWTKVTLDPASERVRFSRGEFGSRIACPWLAVIRFRGTDAARAARRVRGARSAARRGAGWAKWSAGGARRARRWENRAPGLCDRFGLGSESSGCGRS